jgi:hypothetical protein
MPHPFRFRNEFEALAFMEALTEGQLRMDLVLYPFVLDEGRSVPSKAYAEAPFELQTATL